MGRARIPAWSAGRCNSSVACRATRPQLYELALEGVVMFVVLWLVSLKPRPRYLVSGLFALLYGVFRFAVEFVRVPDAQLGYLFGTSVGDDGADAVAAADRARRVCCCAMSRARAVTAAASRITSAASRSRDASTVDTSDIARKRALHDGTLSRSAAPRARSRHRKGRPHRHRHAQRVRLADALRPGARLSAGHHQEAAPEVDRARADLVPARRHQHRLPEGKRRAHLGRMGRRERRPRPGLRRAMARLAQRRRRRGRPDRLGRRRDQAQPRLAPA